MQTSSFLLHPNELFSKMFLARNQRSMLQDDRKCFLFPHHLLTCMLAKMRYTCLWDNTGFSQLIQVLRTINQKSCWKNEEHTQIHTKGRNFKYRNKPQQNGKPEWKAAPEQEWSANKTITGLIRSLFDRQPNYNHYMTLFTLIEQNGNNDLLNIRIWR